MLRERVEGPVRLHRLILGRRQPRALRHEPARRGRAGESQDAPALRLGQPPLPPGTGAVAEPVQPLGVEPRQPLAHGLRMAPQLGRDGTGPQTIPTADHPPRPPNPVARRMAADGQLADLPLLLRVDGGAGTQQLRHGGILLACHQWPHYLYRH